MKKLFYSFLSLAIAALSLSSCEDVPAPYEYPKDNGGGEIISPTDPKGTGTLEDPYNVAGAIKMIKALETGANSAEVYVKGKIVSIKEINTSNFGNATYYISDDGTTKGQLYIFRSLGLGNKKFTSKNIKVGDEVVVCGQFTNYMGNTPETVTNKSYLYSVNGKTSESSQPQEPGTSVDPTGEGTEASPFNVASAMKKDKVAKVFVKGYIVGFIPGKDRNEAKFTAEGCETETNLLIADKADETNIANCMPIQLPSGNIRTGLNLKKNKDLYKKEITLYGDIEKYFGITGLKNVSYAMVGTKSFGTKSSQPGTPSTDILNETFAESIGSFTIANEKDLPQGLKAVWFVDKNYHQVKASAFFQNTKYETESWLISPALDLSGKTTVTLTVEQAANFFKSLKDEIFIKISTNYKSGKPSTATWEVLTPSKWPLNKDWTSVNSTVDLSAYAGKKDVRIAFQYKSSAQSAGTWELKNLVVK